MKNSGIVSYVLKGISLFLVDVITILLVFSVWSITNIKLFPWAFCMILFTLALLNLVVFASKSSIRLFGIGAYASLLASTILYFLFVTVFTGATYIHISVRGYMTITLTAMLVFVGVVAGLYLSGRKKNEDMAGQEAEQKKVLDINLLLINMLENIRSCQDAVEKSDFISISTAFTGMSERLKASTPFGRIAKPVVHDMENQIILKLSEINGNILLLNRTDENYSSCKTIALELEDVKALVMNRERLIVL